MQYTTGGRGRAEEGGTQLNKEYEYIQKRKKKQKSHKENQNNTKIPQGKPKVHKEAHGPQAKLKIPQGSCGASSSP